MTGEERAAYVNAVWQEYISRHGHERLISPIEYALARHWAVNGVPLRVVLRAFKDAGKTGRSLLYMEEPVEAAMKHWEKAMA